MRRSVLLASIALALAAPSCGAGALEPADLPVDRVNCARCGMLVSDVRYAAQVVAAGEEPRFYDDIGCMTADPASRRDGTRAYVRVGDGWVEAQKAWFAKPAGSMTPMGSGIEAFGTAEEARRADQEGLAMAWNELGQEAP